MRVIAAEGYEEQRDALAQDWSNFMQNGMPEVSWLPVPNVGKGVAAYVEQWQLEGFILTGGNDLGEAPLRDETEFALLAYAQAHQLPVVGVCRGLQVMQAFWGGRVVSCDPVRHVAKMHGVAGVGILGNQTPTAWQVNSYHGLGVPVDVLVPELEPLAVSEDGLVEALKHTALPFWAVQWHPERTGPSQAQDVEWMRTCFELPSLASLEGR